MRAAKAIFLLGWKGRLRVFQLGTKNKKEGRTQQDTFWMVIYAVKGIGGGVSA
ncbi:MAG: hypothetical protein RBG13Loki_2723 [Promethearchaeota archaeon CR_4]|nr:MAG: hypothetical protein RBG13Loki_2723 [Candidatus Lokiarchaeota archaeon CR_4]